MKGLVDKFTRITVENDLKLHIKPVNGKLTFEIK